MQTALTLLLAALAMTFIVGARYLIVSGGFAALTRARHPELYADSERRTAQVRREIGWSLSAAAIYGIPAGLVMAVVLSRVWSERPTVSPKRWIMSGMVRRL